VFEILGALGWIVCCVYTTIPAFWLMIHPFVLFWRAQSRSPYRVLLPAWIALWVLAGVVTSPCRDVFLYRNPWMLVPALFLFTEGIWIYVKSSRGFSWIHLSGLPEIRARDGQQTLITSGLHDRVRHPIYLGHLCEMLAWSLGTGLLVCYLLTAFAAITGTIMIHLEDRELEERFGESYQMYRARVPAIVPRILPRWR
jgi:protein-S-isoprenylcysteine O-methyltransferase Ste14